MWKDIKGYEGYYQISTSGSVKALARSVKNKNGSLQNYPEKLLKPDVMPRNNTTYLRVTLSKGHKTKRYQLHRLVAKAFIPNPENKEFVNHIDNNGLNNNLENLEWCTHSENMLHAQAQGRLFESQSKGGKVGSLTNQLKRNKIWESLKNTWVNDWYVLEGNSFYRAKKFYVPARCKCGTVSSIEIGRLNRAEVTACSKCNTRWAKAS